MAAKKRKRRRTRKAAAHCIVRTVCGHRRRICFRKNGKIFSNDPVGGRRRRRKRR